jgi:ABC-type bacteriocin/lantibiotic exporter with double-glycine peptidase domain
MTDILPTDVGRRIKNVRTLTTLLLLLTLLFLVLSPFNFFFWPLFCVTLFPVSIITLIIHYFLGKTRRRNRLIVNEWDNVKIFVGVAGTIVGVILWGVVYIVTH